MQSFLTLYTSCVRELVQLLQGCHNVQPFLKDPAAPFASPTERRIQSLVRTSAVLTSPSLVIHSGKPHTEDFAGRLLGKAGHHLRML